MPPSEILSDDLVLGMKDRVSLNMGLIDIMVTKSETNRQNCWLKSAKNCWNLSLSVTSREICWSWKTSF